MKKFSLIVSLVLLGSLAMWSEAYSATITGKVTKPDGLTALANISVDVYRFEPMSGHYQYAGSSRTTATGTFSIAQLGLGAYYLTVNLSGEQYVGDPFDSNGYYDSYYGSPYLRETYNNVTSLTPTAQPTPIIITTPSQVVPLLLIKMNAKPGGCDVFGPVTINSLSYSYFYQEIAPALPVTGGVLNISFNVRNYGSAAITTNVQPLAYIERRNVSYLKGFRNVYAFAGKTVIVPALGTTNVTFAVTVPGFLMSTTAPLDYSGQQAFNIGIQASSGVANCFQTLYFPVRHFVASSAVVSGEQAPGWEEQQQQRVIPLTLSADGKPVQWGPEPLQGE